MFRLNYVFGPYLLVGASILTGCQDQAAQRPTQMPLKIFTRGRQLTYRVTHLALTGHHVQLDTIMLTSYGDYKPGEYDPVTTQIKTGFSYDGHSAPNNFAGVIENDSLFWSHPPRQGLYAVLELSPFPSVKRPVVVGRQWRWELAVGSQWGDARWATWKGNMLVRTTYRVQGQRTVASRFGPLTCWVVQGRATCYKGVSTLETLYHPAYGFVQLNYKTLSGEQLKLELVKTSLQALHEPLELPGFSLR